MPMPSVTTQTKVKDRALASERPAQIRSRQIAFNMTSIKRCRRHPINTAILVSPVERHREGMGRSDSAIGRQRAYAKQHQPNHVRQPDFPLERAKLDSPDTPLPEKIATGAEQFFIIAAIAGG
jgi:hypothetical protein